MGLYIARHTHSLCWLLICMQVEVYQTPEGIPEAPEAWQPAGWQDYFAPGAEPADYGPEVHPDQQNGFHVDGAEAEVRRPFVLTLLSMRVSAF